MKLKIKILQNVLVAPFQAITLIVFSSSELNMWVELKNQISLIHEQIIQNSFVNCINDSFKRFDSKEWVIQKLDMATFLMNFPVEVFEIFSE